MIIHAFKNGIFPFHHEENRFEDEDHIRDENVLLNYKTINRLIF